MRRHAKAINKHTEKGTYFFDYGNAFLLEASRAGADIMTENRHRILSTQVMYRILWVLCVLIMVLDLFGGFAPLEILKIWHKTDAISLAVLEQLQSTAPEEIQQQMSDNIKWIKGAQEQ